LTREIRIKLFFNASLFVLAMLVGQSDSLAQNKTCDRECLRGFMTQYLNAVVAHRPDMLPLANNIRFTENTASVKIGDSDLWKAATTIKPYRQDILDVREGVAGTHVIVEEAGKPVMLVVRLKIADRKIAEIETQVVRNQQEGAIFEINGLTAPTPGMNMAPPAGQRNSRQELIKAAVFYPLGLKAGSFVKVDAPFAANAYRFENGRLMAGKGCAFQPPSCEDIKSQSISTHPLLIYRVAAVDEEAGITWLRMNFGSRDSYGGGAPAANDKGGKAGKAKGPPTELIVWEAFKVYGGQIHAVEAFMRNTPVGSVSGWDDVYPPITPDVK